MKEREAKSASPRVWDQDGGEIQIEVGVFGENSPGARFRPRTR